MYNSLLHFHSGTRWILLILILLAILNGWTGWKTGKSYGAKDKMVALFTLIFSHLQLLVGFILYFWNEKKLVQFNGEMMSNTVLRFFTLEHVMMMIAAIAVITIGYGRAKRAEDDKQKHRKVFVWYFIALIIIVAAIPWPFRIDGAGWF